MSQNTPLTAISGIGPATAEGFARAGVRSAEEMQAMGAHAAYGAWLRAGNPPHFIGYYALVMALQGRPWNDCRGPEKAALRVKFDALKAECLGGAGRNEKGHLALEAALDLVGVGLRR